MTNFLKKVFFLLDRMSQFVLCLKKKRVTRIDLRKSYGVNKYQLERLNDTDIFVKLVF